MKIIFTGGSGRFAKKFQNKTEDKTTIEVKKSTGTKCTLCWKILDKKCNRKYCGIN